MAENGRPKYRWYILALAMLTWGSIVGAERMCMPVLFKEISLDLNLNLVSIGTIWGLDPLAGVLVGLPGGVLVDRFGAKRTLIVITFLAAVFGAVRGLSVNFLGMAVAMFLFGIVAATLPSVVPKVTAVWFSGRHLGVANGLLNVAWAGGAMCGTMLSATLFSPLLGGWRNVLFLYSAPVLLVSLLWLTTGREPERQDSADASSDVMRFQHSLSKVIRIRQVWIVGLSQLTYFGANMGLMGYVPLYLREIGWTPVAADTVLTVLAGINLFGTIPMVLLSNKLGSRKAVLIFSVIVMVASQGLVPFYNGTALWVLLVASGFLRSGVMSLFNVSILETRGIGSTYGGTAVGLASSIGMIGAFFAPPLGNSFAEFNPGFPFFFWAFLSALALPLLLLIREKGRTEAEEAV